MKPELTIVLCCISGLTCYWYGRFIEPKIIKWLNIKVEKMEEK